MPKLIIAFLIIGFLPVTFCCSQANNINVITKHYATKQYHDFIITGDTIWALATNDKLLCVDANTGAQIESKIKADGSYLFLAKDNSNNLIAANNKYEIKRYNKTSDKWELLFALGDKLTGVVFDSKNNLYLITTKGILDTKTNRTYLPDSLHN